MGPTQRPTRARRRPLPAAFRRVWLVVLTARATQFVEAFLPLLLLHSLGARPGVTAAVLVGQQVGSTLAYACVGTLARAAGLVGALRWGLLGSTAAVAALALAQSAPVAAVGAAAFGAASGTWRAAVQALVPMTLTAPASTRAAAGSGAPERDSVVRARAFGAIFWAANAGAIASAAAGAAGLPLRSLLAAQATTTAAAYLLSLTLPRSLGRGASSHRTPQSQTPTAADLRRARRATWSLIAAFTPATVVMFQAFGGLAVAIPADAYRQMVLVNAVMLLVGQSLAAPFLRWAGASAAAATAVLAMAIGMAGQLASPSSHGWTVLWTLGEVIIVIVPGALVTAAVPLSRAADYVGRFQVAQGLAAAGALYVGPLLAASGATHLEIALLAAGGVGVASVLAARHAVAAAWAQPLTCPCGALFCVCSIAHTPCATAHPTPRHLVVTPSGPRPDGSSTPALSRTSHHTEVAAP